MDCGEIKVPEEFSDISPYNDEDFHKKMEFLVKEPGFEHAVRYVMPNVDYQQFCNTLLKIQNKHDFQMMIMLPFLGKLNKTQPRESPQAEMKILSRVYPMFSFPTTGILF